MIFLEMFVIHVRLMHKMMQTMMAFVETLITVDDTIRIRLIVIITTLAMRVKLVMAKVRGNFHPLFVSTAMKTEEYIQMITVQILQIQVKQIVMAIELGMPAIHKISAR